MRWIRFGEPGAERPGLPIGASIRKDDSGLFRGGDPGFLHDGGRRPRAVRARHRAKAARA